MSLSSKGAMLHHSYTSTAPYIDPDPTVRSSWMSEHLRSKLREKVTSENQTIVELERLLSTLCLRLIADFQIVLVNPWSRKACGLGGGFLTPATQAQTCWCTVTGMSPFIPGSPYKRHTRLRRRVGPPSSCCQLLLLSAFTWSDRRHSRMSGLKPVSTFLPEPQMSHLTRTVGCRAQTGSRCFSSTVRPFRRCRWPRDVKNPNTSEPSC